MQASIPPSSIARSYGKGTSQKIQVKNGDSVTWRTDDCSFNKLC